MELVPVAYAWAGLCERDVQVTSNCIDLREIDPPVDEPLAIGTDATQVPHRRAHWGTIRHTSGGGLRRAACDAIKPARPARLLKLLSTLVKKPRQQGSSSAPGAAPAPPIARKMEEGFRGVH
jgi:hypothetical protein